MIDWPSRLHAMEAESTGDIERARCRDPYEDEYGEHSCTMIDGCRHNPNLPLGECGAEAQTTGDTTETPMSVDLSKATPRPWFDISYGPEVTDGKKTDVTISCSWPDPIDVALMFNGLTATVEERQANARLIVTAVNLHDELVAALRAMVKEIGEYTILSPPVSRALHDARAVLAKLSGPAP